LIQDGTKKRVSSWEHLARLRGDGPGYIQATNYFSDRIPTAGTAPATVELASLEGIPAGDFGELTFVGTVPEVIQVEPEPTPESTPKPGSGSPTESVADSEVEGDAEIQYRVVSGDSLNKIAAKFSVTAAALQAYNSISNPNLISVGQLIRIPKSGTTSQPAPAPDVAEEPEPTPEPEPTATVVEYRVQSGDTLLRIASKFGISSSALQSFNSISNPNRISIGQLLKIPTSTDNTNVAQAQEPEEPEVQKTYTVVSGDTIWGISRKLGVSSSALAKLNGINNSNFIRIGQVLKVPS
jgi:LysM repeat protein